MKKLIERLKSYFPDRAAREEAWLARSVDNFDLERRMRELDRAPRFG